jgi:SAM-dependent methyltransferase
MRSISKYVNDRTAIASPRAAAIYPAVFLTSAGVLMLQISLTRLFSFTLWYHFAYVVISLALLGYGASGAFLSAFPGVLGRNLPRTLFGCAAGAAIVIPLSLLVYAHTPFYPLQLLEQPVQWWYLAAYYVAAGIPFFLSGVCIAGAISAASERVTRVYCADLVGAGLGSAVVVAAIWRLETPGVIVLAAGLMAAAAACWAWWWRPRAALAPLVLILALATAGGRFWRGLEFRPSIEKTMAQLLAPAADTSPAASAEEPGRAQPAGADARRLTRYTHWGAVFRVDVLQPVGDTTAYTGGYRTIGASRQFQGRGPRWVSIPHDGDANAMIYDGADATGLRLFDNHAISLPYRLLKRRPDVLVLGAGGGTEIICGLRHDAHSITAVDLDPLTRRLFTRDFAGFAGRLQARPGVAYLLGEGRSFVRQSTRTYDLIQMNQTDTLTAVSAGANVLNENYLYTVEAYEDYFRHLQPNGLVYVAHMAPPPEEETVRFRQGIVRVAGPLEALRRRGVNRPQDHICVILAPYLMVYMIRPQPFTPQEVDLLQGYCDENGFAPIHLPYRRLDNELSWFVRTSPEARAQYIRSSVIRRDAPTDDCPFVWPYYKWRYVLHPGHTYDRMAMTSGQMIMVPLLGVALAGSLVFILGPLALFRRRGVYSRAAPGLAVYFAALGFGFMFIEISFIQKFVLFLGYPTYSLTVVLSALLVSSGMGSLASQRLISRAERSLAWALVALLVLGVLYLALAETVFGALLGYALWVRIMAAIGLIAPLGFAMGMFFPTGIRVVDAVAPQFVPWAWGINASTSVVATVLAVMLAMTAGFRLVGVCALAIYVIGALGLFAARRRVPASEP